MLANFVAFTALSNWLRGFERYGLSYSKALIPESSYPEAFYVLRDDEPHGPGLAKARKLIAKVNTPGDRVVALHTQLPLGPDGARPNDVTGTGLGWRWPAPRIPLTGVSWVGDDGALTRTHHEDVTAQAFALHQDDLRQWDECRPRSFSVLPVAKACQARCGFCFSKASVSDLARQPSATLEQVLAWASLAKARGAERAVITGGGEPTLVGPERLEALVRGLSERFEKTLLITNGARLDEAQLRGLRSAGLTTLALSRHGVDAEGDARIMGLEVDSARLARAGAALGLRTRAICVLQRSGVHDEASVQAALERAVADGFDEVCFKELYVSSLSENPWGQSAVNRYCEAHQVPLTVVSGALSSLGFELADRLPWGSPVYAGRIGGRAVRVAAYTEPSVGWERAHGLVRSWNVLADGSCLASLEDPASTLRPGACRSAA